MQFSFRKTNTHEEFAVRHGLGFVCSESIRDETAAQNDMLHSSHIFAFFLNVYFLQVIYRKSIDVFLSIILLFSHYRKSYDRSNLIKSWFI